MIDNQRAADMLNFINQLAKIVYNQKGYDGVGVGIDFKTGESLLRYSLSYQKDSNWLDFKTPNDLFEHLTSEFDLLVRHAQNSIERFRVDFKEFNSDGGE